jgi:hypothetical protein
MKTPCSLATTWKVAAFVLAALAGCGGGATSKPPQTAAPAPVVPQTTAEELTAPEGELKFGALRLFQGAELGLTLGTDGSIDVPGRGVVGRLEHDGRFVDGHEKTLLKLMPEGELVLPSGAYLPVTMDKDGTVHLLKEGRVVRLKGDGTLEGANPSAPAIRVEGVAPATQRTAMFLLVLASYPILNHP